jgi:hypothetical protein
VRLTEVTVVCDQCMKFARTEIMHTRLEYENMVLVECHGVARMTVIFAGDPKGGSTRKLLWSQIQNWLGPEDAAREIGYHEESIARSREAIAMWRRVR